MVCVFLTIESFSMRSVISRVKKSANMEKLRMGKRRCQQPRRWWLPQQCLKKCFSSKEIIISFIRLTKQFSSILLRMSSSPLLNSASSVDSSNSALLRKGASEVRNSCWEDWLVDVGEVCSGWELSLSMWTV